ncbi:MAG: T9SS C-terminal target domain-containing protein [Candidatus Zixiibacteriota bacterium]|nr:MAG: T9SS C-terminal target domain-containing protein [candidate division Zixibacteria bacterium]
MAAIPATFDVAGLASGVYLVRMEAGGFTQTQKLILLK